MRLFGIAIGLSALVLAGLFLPSGTADADHIDPGDEEGRQFVWPTSAWIAANDEYYNGNHHPGGSADLAAPLYSPIHPARDGEVIHSGFRNGSWSVQIAHPADDGDTYMTHYGHLPEEPMVDVGDEVDLSTQIGYVGRTGNANFSGPHIHFGIRLMGSDGDETFKIPGLEIGDWAETGDYIRGDYPGLSPMSSAGEAGTRAQAATGEQSAAEHYRPFDVVVTDEWTNVYETVERQSDDVVARLGQGHEIGVLATERGQYQVEVDGELGWIAHSSTAPSASEVFDVRIHVDNAANVRSGPGEDHDRIGSIPGGINLAGYERDGDWMRVMWPCDAETNRSDDPDDDDRDLGGCPGRDSDAAAHFKYGWVGPGAAEETHMFDTRTRQADIDAFANVEVDGENQPDCPCNSDTRVGQIEQMTQKLTVHETRNGWYRVQLDNDPVWIRGWLTAARQ